MTRSAPPVTSSDLQPVPRHVYPHLKGFMFVHRGPRLSTALLLAIVSLCSVPNAQAQCDGAASTPASIADCAAHAIPPDTIAKIDPNHTYSLAELIDIAEHNNPRTRIVWERAKQSAERLGLEKSAYYPILAAVATFADQRIVSPFPAQLLPRGYSLVEIPLVQPELTLNYLLIDFGGRAGRVDGAKAEKLAAGANFIAANQQVAFSVASSYYRLLTAQERLVATQDTLKTAKTTQDAAENQLANGRSTMPDVLNARAETAQAVFDMESADGDEKIARVQLTEVVGAEPSPFIKIDGQKDSPLPDDLSLSVEELIDRAMKDRPDLAAEIAEIRAANDAIRVAKAAYRPTVGLSGSGAQTIVWPTSNSGPLGDANQTTWSVGLGIEWRLFDGGARKNQLLIAQSREREAKYSLRETRDKAVREVWTAYIAFHTAQRKQEASVALLESANSSYSASLEAYQYGVKNLVDVVTAERQLAQARLSGVSARSQLFLEAVDLEFVTGNLLRSLPPAAKLQSLDTVKPQDGTVKPQDGPKP